MRKPLSTMRWFFCLFVILSVPSLAVGQPGAGDVVLPDGFENLQKIEDLPLIKGRLKGYLGAYESWLDQVCDLTDEQRALLSKACAEAAERFESRFRVFIQRASITLSEYMSTPILFGGSENGASSVFDQKLTESIQKILTPSQRQTLDSLMEQRRARQHHVCVSHIIELMDEFLYLNGAQHQKIQQKLEKVRPTFSNALYTFRMDPFELPAKCLGKQSWYPKESLTSAQQVRSEFVVNALSIDFEPVDASCSEQEFCKIIDARVQKHLPSLESYVAVPMEFYRDQLDANSFRQLQTAGHGAIERFIVDWRRSQLEQLFSNTGDVQRDAYFVQGPIGFLFDYEAVWESTLHSDRLQAANDLREVQHAAHMKEFAGMLFDQELWLTSAQEAELEKYMEASIQLLAFGQRKYAHISELHTDLWHFGRILHSIPDAKMSALLSPEQFEVWKLLKKELPLEENVIIFTRRHGIYHLGNLWIQPTTKNN